MRENDWIGATVTEIHPFVDSNDAPCATVRLDDGKVRQIFRGKCYRDGTSPSFIQVGDKGRYHIIDGGFSCPNWNRKKAAAKTEP